MNKDIDQLIYRYLSEEGTSDEVQQLDVWLSEDKEHIRYFFRIKNLYDAAHPAFAPDTIDEQKAHRDTLRRINGKRSATRWWFTAAAAVVALLVVTTVTLHFTRTEQSTKPDVTQSPARFQQIASAMLVLPSGEEIPLGEADSLDITENNSTVAKVKDCAINYSDNETDAPVEAYHLLRIPRGGEFKLTLSDGTRIWINAETEVRYPSRFTGQERKIYVTGEAYLEVAHNAEQPFKVVMPQSEVTVLGTSFNVSTYPELREEQVTLLKGKVRVCTQANGQTIVLNPGEQASVSKADGALSKRAVDPELYCAWHKGVLAFNNSSLETILTTLSRVYDIKVRWEDESLKRLAFTGEIQKYEQTDKFLQMISLTNDVRFEIHGREIIVMKP